MVYLAFHCISIAVSSEITHSAVHPRSTALFVVSRVARTLSDCRLKINSRARQYQISFHLFTRLWALSDFYSPKTSARIIFCGLRRVNSLLLKRNCWVLRTVFPEWIQIQYYSYMPFHWNSVSSKNIVAIREQRAVSTHEAILSQNLVGPQMATNYTFTFSACTQAKCSGNLFISNGWT